MRYDTKIFNFRTLLGAAALLPYVAQATCWEEASQSYGIPVTVLIAVAKTESGFKPDALNRNTNGSRDIGLMQINDIWLPTLAKFGINEKALLDACTNLKVGAWILSNNAKKLGWNWNAIGAYNVGCAKLSAQECERRRNRYAWKIHSAMNKVTDIKGAAPKALLKSYEKGATQVSDQLVKPAPRSVEPKKFMLVQLAEASVQNNMTPEVAGEKERNLTIGGFLNYAEEHERE